MDAIDANNILAWLEEILAVWDDDDANDDAKLHAAYAYVLILKSQKDDHLANDDHLRKIEERIEQMRQVS